MRNKGLLVIVGVLVASGWVNAQTRSDLSDLTREFVSVDAPVIALTDVIVIDGSGGEPRSGSCDYRRPNHGGRAIIRGGSAQRRGGFRAEWPHCGARACWDAQPQLLHGSGWTCCPTGCH